MKLRVEVVQTDEGLANGKPKRWWYCRIRTRNGALLLNGRRFYARKATAERHARKLIADMCSDAGLYVQGDDGKMAAR